VAPVPEPNDRRRANAFQRFTRLVQAVSAAVLAFVAAGLIGVAAMIITEG
jgi:hypothetical protein